MHHVSLNTEKHRKKNLWNVYDLVLLVIMLLPTLFIVNFCNNLNNLDKQIERISREEMTLTHIQYNTFDAGPAFEVQGILEEINVPTVTDEEVWEDARSFNRLPNFENILTALVYGWLEDAIRKQYPETKDFNFETWVNCADSKFYINGEVICSLNDIKDILHKTFLKKLEEIEIDFLDEDKRIAGEPSSPPWKHGNHLYIYRWRNNPKRE